MTISTLPAAPSRATDTAAQFSSKADALLAALATFVSEANALGVALNLNATTDTSNTSNTIGTGSKTFTVSASKSFQPGMYLVIADTAAPSTNSMFVQVTSYSGTTLVVNCISFGGSGTKTAWTISQSGLTIVTADNVVTVHTGNGHGSTNTRIRRFTTTLVSTGTAVTYADSATLGASFTINEAGLYELYYTDIYATGAAGFGASLNSAELTTGIASILIATRLMHTYNAAAGIPGAVARTVRLAAGDVVRPHTDANVNNATAQVYFSIRKVGP